MFISKREFKI